MALKHKVSGSGDEKYLYCNTCGKSAVIKNNIAIAEELERRQGALSGTNNEQSCRDVACASHGKGLNSHPDLYRPHGRTASGKPRVACRSCGKTFTVGPPTLRQHKPHINGRILMLLVSKVPLTRIAKVVGISMSTLYGKIDFIYNQSRQFMAHRERQIPKLPPRRWELSTDRQDINVNWPSEKRATIQLSHPVTVDRRTQYILAIHSQFDADVDPVAYDQAFSQAGDINRPRCFRDHDRVWTEAEYQEYLNYQLQALDATDQHIKAQFEALGTVDNERAPDQPDDDRMLPPKGGMVHIDIVLFAHFLYIRQLLGDSAKSLLYCLDRDAGAVAACMAGFVDLIAKGRAEVAVVDFQKDMTIDRKRRAVGAQRATLRAHMDALPLFPRDVVMDLVVANEMRSRLPQNVDQRAAALAANPYYYPFSMMSEPLKNVRVLSGAKGYSWDALARLMRRASLHPADRVMMRLRRQVVGLERGVASPRRDRCIWNLYAYYDASMIEKMTTIFRMWHNYMEAGKDGQTPAQRLGLAKGKVYERDLFRFR